MKELAVSVYQGKIGMGWKEERKYDDGKEEKINIYPMYVLEPGFENFIRETIINYGSNGKNKAFPRQVSEIKQATAIIFREIDCSKAYTTALRCKKSVSLKISEEEELIFRLHLILCKEPYCKAKDFTKKHLT